MKPLSPFVAILGSFLIILAVGTYVLVLPLFGAYARDSYAASHFGEVTGNTAAETASRVSTLAALKESAFALIPSGDEQYDLSVQIEALCHATGVTIGSLGVAPPATGAKITSSVGLPTVDVTLGISGSYDAVKATVDGLTALGRYVEIKQLVVSAAAPATGSTSGTASSGTAPSATGGAVSAQIAATAFYMTPAATAAPTK